MSNQTARVIRRQQSQGHTWKWLCETHGVTRSELKAILSQPPATNQSAAEKRRKAMAEMRAEGFGDEQIRAVFG